MNRSTRQSTTWMG